MKIEVELFNGEWFAVIEQNGEIEPELYLKISSAVDDLLDRLSSLNTENENGGKNDASNDGKPM